jgi:hypothetical protein
MNEQIWRALESDRTIDITTTGRVSGLTRRIEIWFHNVDGAIYITGTPGTRDWYANLLAEPSFTFHLKDSTQADLAATADPVTDPGERRRLLEVITDRVDASHPVDKWVAESPLVHVEFEPDL